MGEKGHTPAGAKRLPLRLGLHLRGGLPGPQDRCGARHALREHGGDERPPGRNQRQVSPGAHALLVLDGAGWHSSTDLIIPPNISLLPLPPYSPELNPVENLWQFLRQNTLANRVFDSYDAIVDVCCDAWNTLLAMPERVASITSRDWAQVSG